MKNEVDTIGRACPTGGKLLFNNKMNIEETAYKGCFSLYKQNKVPYNT